MSDTIGLPLHGVRILDLTRLLPGGYLTMLLGDLGADVVKVEEPGRGDYIRAAPPPLGRESAVWWLLGRNKRSVVLDLKTAAGVEALLRLSERADVVVEGFRPGVVDRLGVGYAAVSQRNPRAVYASLTGFGSQGEMRVRAAHDINAIALAGVLGMTGAPGGPPAPPAVQVADLGSALMLAVALLAALHGARESGRGSHVEVSMEATAFSMASPHAVDHWASGAVPGPGEGVLTGGIACYGVYACAGGGHIAVGALEPQFWSRFCATAGCPELESRAYDPAARADVAAVVATRTRDEWVRAFEGIDACVTPVLRLDEAIAHPLNAPMVTEMPHPDMGSAPTVRAPLTIDGAHLQPRSAPPRLGEHTRELLRDAGLSEAEIDAVDSGAAVRGA
jgi:crotonobetainyl-CoA:carnitine CoA-transferase CaiB-like acyl-CoA transferase